jgi:hypothetical protein
LRPLRHPVAPGRLPELPTHGEPLPHHQQSNAAAELPVIDALVSGRIYGSPAERIARNGSRFVTAKIRVPTRDGAAQFINVIAFANTAITALLALEDGDAVALGG